MTPLTFDPAGYRSPVWSPDGKYVAFASDYGGNIFQIYRKESSGTGAQERLTEGGNSKSVLDWSKDGKYLLYREEPVTGPVLMALPLTGDRKAIPIAAKTGFFQSTGAISPDGHWVAYTSNDSGEPQLYVQAFPGGGSDPKGGRWQISKGSAYEVKWRGDGKEIYYQTTDGRRIMAAAIQTGAEGVRVEEPRVLFTAEYQALGLHQFDVTPDGQRFLMILNPNTEGNADRLTIVTNWQAALRK